MPVTVGAPASLDMTAKAGHITLHSHPAVTGSVFMRGSKSFMGQCADSMIPTSGNRPRSNLNGEISRSLDYIRPGHLSEVLIMHHYNKNGNKDLHASIRIL